MGWLTLFGARCRDLNKASKEIVDSVVTEGGRLARTEASKLVKLSARYGTVLNFLSKLESAKWTQIKAILEAQEKRSLPNPTIAAILNRLVKTGLLLKRNKEYCIADPLLAYGILQEPFPPQ